LAYNTTIVTNFSDQGTVAYRSYLFKWWKKNKSWNV